MQTSNWVISNSFIYRLADHAIIYKHDILDIHTLGSCQVYATKQDYANIVLLLLVDCITTKYCYSTNTKLFISLLDGSIVFSSGKDDSLRCTL